MEMGLIKITQSNEASDKNKENFLNNRHALGSTTDNIFKQTIEMSTFAQD